MPHDDRSVHFSGGINQGQINTGDNTTMNQSPPLQTTPLAAALDRVEELLETHSSSLDEADRALRDLRDLREEAESTRPDITRRDSALSRLTHRVSTVAPLLTAVESVRNLLA